MRFFRKIRSSSESDLENVTRFAMPVMRVEAQQGVLVPGTLTMLLMTGLAQLYRSLKLGTACVRTFAKFAALSDHTALSAKMVSDTKAQYAAKDHASRCIV
jgi:hypothetical protein